MSVKLNDYTCNVKGMYPMFSSELSLYSEIGLERFWHHPGWDPFNIHRQPLSTPA
jgi:hypothetical protein